jgi:hypothetical protein
LIGGEPLTISARQVDPRDQKWEIYDPVYRVYFWHPQSPAPNSMWTGDEWELTGVADMEAAMQWAKDHCDGVRSPAI